jgi:hypothetical protein
MNGKRAAKQQNIFHAGCCSRIGWPQKIALLMNVSTNATASERMAR